ncbi:MAG: 2Fe-2S iron-sulfur cluster-binding protein, partial [Sphingomonadaceae bacterium]
MAWLGEIDLGTKSAPLLNGKMVSLTIDGEVVEVPEGISIMRAAALMGTSIPKLCATDNLEAFGSCRLCLV